MIMAGWTDGTCSASDSIRAAKRLVEHGCPLLLLRMEGRSPATMAGEHLRWFRFTNSEQRRTDVGGRAGEPVIFRGGDEDGGR